MSGVPSEINAVVLTPELVAMARRGVTMVTRVERAYVVYELYVGDSVLGGDRGHCRRVWRLDVRFGQNPFNRPGGTAFRSAARAQAELSTRFVNAARLAEFRDEEE